MAAPALIVDTTVRFLRAHVPFARMARKDLEFIAERAQLAYFPVGTSIVMGFIALQVHGIGEGTGPYSVQWRNIKIKEMK